MSEPEVGGMRQEDYSKDCFQCKLACEFLANLIEERR